ncbi:MULTISPECIES: hypothetical protein [unclassified Nonomuraea]|uniref:hypothetical protein n=1 Tax=unclassified Nonomuraea TaxID=2593643 RepID=UPI0033F289EA
MAITADRLLSSAAAATGLSPVGDSLALSGRALLDVRGQVEQVAAVPARLAAQARGADRELIEAGAAELLRRAIAQVSAPTRPPAGDPRIRVGRALVEQLYVMAAEIGRMCLEITPAYLPEAEAPDVLAVFADEIGTDLATVPPYRRYALTARPALPHRHPVTYVAARRSPQGLRAL